MPKRSKSRAAKPIPKFETEAQAAEFWNTHDSTEHIDWDKAVVHRDHPPTKAVSFRLPEPMIGKLKQLAITKSIPYQTLARSYIAAGISREQREPKSSSGRRR